MRLLRTVFATALLTCATGLALFTSGPKSELDPFWKLIDGADQDKLSHAEWQGVLDDYLVVESPGANRFDYEGLQVDKDPRLDRYINSLTSIDPRLLARDAQMAYWINLYNSLTVRLIRDNYPVPSITELGSSLLSRGPWDDEIVSVAGRVLTLNDIEHRILRPVFEDYRIHFAVNCASIGCPDLSPLAFTADNLDRQLDSLARAFLSDPRGIELDREELRLSKIFQWFREDFGQNEREIIDTLAKYLDDGRAAQLRDFSGEIDYHYDWSLNSL